MMPLITDDNYTHFLDHVNPDGTMASKGLVERDFKACPEGYLPEAPGFDLGLIPEQEIPGMIREQEEKKTSCEHVIRHYQIPYLDQDGYGYCWAHSTTQAAITARAMAGLPHIPLSAFHVAAIIKNYRDQGGWNAESLQFIAQKGVCSQEFWPQGKVSRSYDTPEMWANAALHKVTEWMDLNSGSNPQLLKQQIATCLLLGMPLAMDFNWWGHSVMGARLVSWNPFTVRIRNSWINYGDFGFGDLQGNRAMPNGCVAVRVMKASDK